MSMIEKLKNSKLLGGIIPIGKNGGVLVVALTGVLLSASPALSDSSVSPAGNVSSGEYVAVVPSPESLRWEVYDKGDYDSMYSMLPKEVRSSVDERASRYEGVGNPENFRRALIEIEYLRHVLHEIGEPSQKTLSILKEASKETTLKKFAERENVKEILFYVNGDYGAMEKRIDVDEAKKMAEKAEREAAVKGDVSYVLFNREAAYEDAVKELYGKKYGIVGDDGSIVENFDAIKRRIVEISEKETSQIVEGPSI